MNAGLALIVIFVGLVGVLVGMLIEHYATRPPSHIAYCLSGTCHEAGRKCPACGPDKPLQKGRS